MFSLNIGRPIAAVLMTLALATAGCSELREAVNSEFGDNRYAPPVQTIPAERTDAGTPVERAKDADLAATQPDMQAPPEAEFYPGTGDLIDSNVASQLPAPEDGAGTVTLNFVGADIREVVRSILGDTLGVNYVVDPKVQGTITVQTSRPLARDGLLPMLEEVLRLNGLALISNAGVYEVVPLQEAPAGGALTRPYLSSGGAEQGFSIRIIPLAYIGAAEMSQILEPMVAPGRILRVDTLRNLLMIAGTQKELEAQQDLVDIFDVDWMAGMSFAMFPLEAAAPDTLIGELEQIFGDQESGPTAGLIRFIPVERLNAILVIAARPAQMRQAETWIKRLDQGSEANERRLYVYYVQNGRASDLADVLNQVFEEQRRRDLPSARLAPGRERVELTSARPSGDGGEGAEGESRPAAEPVSRGGRPAGGAGGQGIAISDENEVRIIADEANNALVILATPGEYRNVELAIRKLDIVPLQVLIEATIAEVTLDDDLRYGVQWFFSSGNSTVTLSEVATGVAAQQFPGFSYLINSTDIRVVLNALESVTEVNVVSAPQIMVLDNETATIQVGDEVPIATQSAVDITNPNAPIVNSIEFRDTGVILSVTPRVNAGGLVIMDIEQEVSDVVVTLTSGIDSPTIQQRRIESSVAIQSGESVALGGLIKDDRNKIQAGVPILSSIPVIGSLFGRTVDDFERTELMVIITPRVVGTVSEARDVTNELREKMRGPMLLEQRVK